MGSVRWYNFYLPFFLRDLYEVDHSLYEVDRSLYEVDRSFYEVDRSFYEVDRSLYRVDRSLYEVDTNISSIFLSTLQNDSANTLSRHINKKLSLYKRE
jgi:hypothetical protein